MPRMNLVTLASTTILALLIAAPARAQVVGDFNRDGFLDLAVGVPGEDFGGAVDAGAVHVFYGTTRGLRTARNQFFHQASPGLDKDNETGDRFGAALAVGDFDADGFDDLAIGVPFESFSGIIQGGHVYVIYGSLDGLNSEDSLFLKQSTNGLRGNSQDFDNFGMSLAAGDFNGDGRDDLAIGVPGERVGGESNAGAVNIIYSGFGGLDPQNSDFLHQNRNGSKSTAEAGDQFGRSLSTGDYNGDGWDDLAVGVPGQSTTTDAGAGAVHIFFGSADGIGVRGDQFLVNPDPSDVGDGGEILPERFGSVLSTGDFNGDFIDDLAVGVPLKNYRENGGDADSAGAVYVFYGSERRLDDSDSAFVFQSTRGVNEQSEDGDQFGAALVAGDFNGDGRDDLAVGAPSEDLGGVLNAGLVHVFYGAPNGVKWNWNQRWHQNNRGISDRIEENDRFGAALAAADFDRDGYMDLAIGVPGEDPSGVVGAGAVAVLYGGPNGIVARGDGFFHQDKRGVPSRCQTGDGFGSTLAPAK